MALITIAPNKWKISKEQLRFFNREEIENMLSSFNRSCGGSYYMVDYHSKEVFVDSFAATILCGHPKEVADKEGIDFFNRILDKENQEWLAKVGISAFRFFHEYDENQRKNVRLSYGLTLKTINGQEAVVYQKVTPFKLCGNGNLWLALAHVTEASKRETIRKAHITNTINGKKYDFVNGEFALSDTVIFTDLEKQILMLMAKDLTTKQISETLNVPVPTFNRHKRKIFDKLGVDKSTSAIHKAHTERLI